MSADCIRHITSPPPRSPAGGGQHNVSGEGVLSHHAVWAFLFLTSQLVLVCHGYNFVFIGFLCVCFCTISLALSSHILSYSGLFGFISSYFILVLLFFQGLFVI